MVKTGDGRWTLGQAKAWLVPGRLCESGTGSVVAVQDTYEVVLSACRRACDGTGSSKRGSVRV